MNTNDIHENNKHVNEYEYPMASLNSNFFTKELPGQPLSVIKAKNQNKTGQKLLIEGIIGGREKPFSANRASFILGDISLETCDKKPGDNCPTPWDACCEDRKKLLLGTMNIQFLDINGSLIHGNLDGVGGLKPGVKVKVSGVVDSTSIREAMVLNAHMIQVM